jgi:hypothetical protein
MTAKEIANSESDLTPIKITKHALKPPANRPLDTKYAVEEIQPLVILTDEEILSWDE